MGLISVPLGPVKLPPQRAEKKSRHIGNTAVYITTKINSKPKAVSLAGAFLEDSIHLEMIKGAKDNFSIYFRGIFFQQQS